MALRSSLLAIPLPRSAPNPKEFRDGCGRWVSIESCPTWGPCGAMLWSGSQHSVSAHIDESSRSPTADVFAQGSRTHGAWGRVAQSWAVPPPPPLPTPSLLLLGPD